MSHEQALKYLREIATGNPMAKRRCCVCVFCGDDANRFTGDEKRLAFRHDPSCLWLRLRRYFALPNHPQPTRKVHNERSQKETLRHLQTI